VLIEGASRSWLPSSSSLPAKHRRASQCDTNRRSTAPELARRQVAGRVARPFPE
jgi:hypothetical protein